MLLAVSSLTLVIGFITELFPEYFPIRNTGRYQDSGKPDSEYYTLFESFTVSSLYPVLVFVVRCYFSRMKVHLHDMCRQYCLVMLNGLLATSARSLERRALECGHLSICHVRTVCVSARLQGDMHVSAKQDSAMVHRYMYAVTQPSF